MARNSLFLLAALALTVGPVACLVSVDDGPGGPGGPGGTGAYGNGGSTGTMGTGAGPTKADSCNPVTAAGCPADGSTCDIGPSGFFQCFPPPNTVDVCGTCDNSTAFCGPDLTCVFPSAGASAGACFHYCCTDADCGGGATCDTTFAATALTPSNGTDRIGLCVTSASTDVPSCAPPGATPSGGSCVGGYVPGDGGTGGSTGDGGTGGSTADGGGTGGGPAGDGGTGGSAGDGGTPPGDGGGFMGGWDGGHGGRHDAGM